MAVRIRMTRMGKKDRPFYRIGAYDSRSPRDGKAIENLGWYDPITTNEEGQLKVKLERIEHWLSVGALPTEKTRPILKKAGVKFPQKAKKKKAKSEGEKSNQFSKDKGGKGKGKKKK